MPAVQAIDGCIGMSAMVERESGRCIITTAWETEEAMRASAEQASLLRARAAEKFDSTVDKIEEWEIGALHRDHRTSDGACTRVTWVRVAADQVEQGIE